jgi:protein tyrosine kinase modulator
MEEEVKGLGDYLDIIGRRKYWVIITTLTLMLVSTAVIYSLPTSYKSEGLILIESQEIPNDLVRTTVTSYAEQRIEIIRQRLLTTDNILRLVENHDLYANARKKMLPSSAIIELFKENLVIEMVEAEVRDSKKRGRNRSANIAFTISFLDESPKKAQIIASEIATKFLSENVRSRTEKATETKEFLKLEGDKFQKKVQKIEKDIADFKDKNSDSLPELLQYNLSMVERLQEELATNQNQIIVLKDQITILTVEMTNIHALLATNPGLENSLLNSKSGPSIDELKIEYTQLLTRYSESHPDVQRLKRQIEVLEKEHADGGELEPVENELKAQSDNFDNPVFLDMKTKIHSSEREIVRLRNRQNELRSKLVDYENRVNKTHQVKRAYDDMSRDYENNLAQYKELRAKQLDAELGENLESENKAESFTLIEPPRFPSKAEKPNRPKLLAISMMMSLGGGFGLALFVESLIGGIRGYTELTRVTGQAPLIVVPMIKTQQDIKQRRTRRNRWLLLLFIVCLGVIAGIHYYVMDLEVLWFEMLRTISSV